ncbi:TonB-dependent hemoglobin/transferrin/lactoferrin family receptor [Aquamicrobium soli]|jgi:hemoglobin/transferrin/lactoferrin receptor protein|uniref:TonB-dependent hemoglobin/transferrin/lactoferrin family receptor n=1 Tax=Aquamicrobium soli TaxID=1811518 RepID=A0ABV7KF97_9HYPH
MLAGVAVIALTSAAAAQEASDQAPSEAQAAETKPAANATLLDKILLLSRTGETVIESLSASSHVDQEQLERRMATTVNDVFFGVPGITLQSDARRAASSVNIRGLQDFGRVAVIVDGARQNFQRSDHGTQSTFFIDPELVKSVDVTRGPVTNTYGSGAIGGVVMFDTKDAGDFLKPDETWASSLSGRYETNGKGWTTSATGAYRFSDDFDVLGNIVYRDFSAYKDGGGDIAKGTGFDMLSGMLKTSIRPTENSELKLGWIGTKDSWTEFGSATDHAVDTRQNTFTGRYNVTDEDKSWLDLHINASYNKVDMTRTYLKDALEFVSITQPPILVPAGSQSKYDLDTYGIDIWNTSRFETGTVGHEVTYGGDWVNDDVVTARAQAGGMDVYTPSGKRSVGGAYIQDKLTWERFEVIAGLRYDNYELESDVGSTSGDRLSPRITVGVSPFQTAALEGLQFYGTYAEGYRSPSVTETLISGTHPNTIPFLFLPNPNLKPEIGKTWEAGLNYKLDDMLQPGDSLRIKAGYFNNDIDDFIEQQIIPSGGPASGCFAVPFCLQYQNYSSARIRGFEFEGVYDAAWGFAGLSASIINGHTVDATGLRDDLKTIPSAQVTGQLGFRFLEDRLTVGGEVQYNGKPKGNPIARDYTLVNAFAAYQANDNLKVDFRVDNLFDVKYLNPLNFSTNSVVYEPGVTFKLGATMRFGG